jgi:hypothetical protein
VTKECDLVGGSERQVDKETVGCDVGVTKEDYLVGGSERQVDKEIVGCDVGVTKEKGLISGDKSWIFDMVIYNYIPTVNSSFCNISLSSDLRL